MNNAWLQIETSDPYILSATVHDVYGGKKIYLHMNAELIDTIQWVRQHKAQLAHEQQMRMNNPDLQELYLSYQTALNLISK